MKRLAKGRYIARISQCARDIEDAQALRQRAFLGSNGRDQDPFDTRCLHVLVHERRSARLVCCCRLLPLENGDAIDGSYSAQFYDLEPLRAFEGPMLEMGRFCVDPDVQDPDVIRVIWAAMTQYVDESGAQMLFGCSSFAGTDQDDYMDAFAVLHEKHLAPKRWLPKVKAQTVFPFASHFRKQSNRKTDRKRAMLRMPPLLRTYLLMGGWVSDHAVVDPDLNTLHVFTGLEISAIPPARKRLLRASVG